MITAPFNFVPLSEKVFFPDWADSVSHDVPFEDSQSGSIDISITAKSPIFIRDHEKEKEFCQYKGEYYIPGSSVKGMIRNVLEIMSFSKMSFVDDDTYAVRDLSSAKNFYMKQMNLIDEPITRAGWLKVVDGKYFIEDCGLPQRISHREIDKATGVNFANNFENNGFEKTSEFKYNILGKPYQKIKVGEVYTSKTNAKYDKRKFCKYNSNGKEATLVVTGQPTKRQNTGKMGDGKGYEFIFLDPTEDLTVSQEIFENFLFAYFDGRTTEPKESLDWIFWKKRLVKGEKVPVFFQKSAKKVLHFGLSYLYKLPYNHSIKDGLPSLHKDNRLDLAQTIFGHIQDDNTLKGRVQFSHFKAMGNIQHLKPRTEILGTPRASYYPMYVKQQEGKLFTTFMDGGFNISGWKRYPIHKNGVQKTTDTGNENVGTTFSPLKEGVVFQGKVRYHNLKKAELGALLSALSFHNTKGCFHNIGMAKSLGYGKVELKIDGIELEEYLKAFEVEVSEQVGEWSKSEQMQELLSMATEQENCGNSKLKYMELTEFADHKSDKKGKDFLRNYTMLEGINSVAPKSLITEADLEALRERQVQRAKEEKLRQEQQKREEQHKKEWKIVYASTNLSTIEAFVSKYPESKYLETAHAKIAEIKEKLLNEEQEEAEVEAKAKWEAVQNVDKKFYKKALEDFIANYGDSTFVSNAKKELENLARATVTKSTNQSLDFSKADDAKSIERAMKSVQNPSEEDKDKLEEAIKNVYPSLNAKKKKQFVKMKLMIKWLGKERFQKITL